VQLCLLSIDNVVVAGTGGTWKERRLDVSRRKNHDHRTMWWQLRLPAYWVTST
jgi:hypothetical protein